jgi:hypothetical protein
VSPFAAKLEDCDTRWDLAVLLLRTWQDRPADRPLARHSRHDDVRDAFFSVADEVRAHFDAAPGALDLTGDDRALVGHLTDGGHDHNAVDAVAHGLHLAAGATFTRGWHDRLGADHHQLQPGDIYPVADPPWPARAGIARRTPAARSVAIADDDHPRARVHRGGPIAIAFDFSLHRPLHALGDGLCRAGTDRVAAALPNATLAELGWAEPRAVAYPVAPADPAGQAARIRALIAAAQERDARIVVLPELSATPEIADQVAALLDAESTQRLVVCGSWHAKVGGEPANVAAGLLTGCAERLTHRKLTEVTRAFPRDPADRFREGIAAPRPPLVTVHVAGPWRFAVVICKDFLDPAVRGALQRAGANVLLVPSMSELTQPFEAEAQAHVAASQALSLCANGPDDWGLDVREPAARMARPYTPHTVVDGPPAPAPALVTFDVVSGTAVGQGL